MTDRGQGSPAARTSGFGRLRPLAFPVYLPLLLYMTGAAAILPMIPIGALQLGYSSAGAAGILTVAGLLNVLGPIPAGLLLLRIDERRALIYAAIVSGLALGLAIFALVTANGSSKLLFAGAVMAFFGAEQIWDIGRQSYLAEHLPADLRARGMTLFGATMRAGRVVGPVIGAGIVALGGTAGAFVLAIIMVAAAAVVIGRCMLPRADATAVEGADEYDPATSGDSETAFTTAAESETASELATENAELAPGRVPEESVVREGRPPEEPETGSGNTRGTKRGPRAARSPALRGILIVGAGIVALMVARSARDLVLPLWGNSIGLHPSTISLTVGIAAAVEISLFYPAGALMDRFGRAAVAVPCTALLGVGLAILPLRSGLLWFVVATIVMSLGNGLGSGIVKTLSIDLTPVVRRTYYLGIWNSLTNIGVVAGPGLLAVAAATAGLAEGIVATGVIAMIGAVWLAFSIPRFVATGLRARR